MGLLSMQNAILMAAPHIESASGSIASFDTNFPARLKSCVVTINPVQSGSGDPSPDNVRPITGRTSLDLHIAGKNLLCGDDFLTVLRKTYNFSVSTDATEGRYISFTASAASERFQIRKPNVRFKPNTRYTIIAKNKRSSNGTQNIKVFYTDGTSEFIWSAKTTPTVQRMVTASGKTVSRIGGGNSGGTTTLYIDSFGIFEGVINIDDYVPYVGTIKGIALDPPGTVYGGTLDVVSGVLTVDKAAVDLGSLSWTKKTGTQTDYFTANVTGIKSASSATSPPDILCTAYKPTGSTYVSYSAYPYSIGVTTSASSSAIYVQDLRYSNKDDFTTAVNGVLLVYPLKTPQTYQLTPQEINALKGQNHLWADCGDVALKYWKH